MAFRQVTPEVYYPEQSQVFLGDEDLDWLRRRAAANPRRRARFCTHPSPEDKVHEMVIVHDQTAYLRPHSHPHKAESLMVLDGRALAVFFAADGAVQQVVPLSPPGQGGTFYYRVPAGIWHTLVILSPSLTFLEVAPGPFATTGNVFPDWAPDGSDDSAAQHYSAALRDAALAASPVSPSAET